MKIPFRFAFVLYILLQFSSCRKLNSHYYEGLVTDAGTGQPIERATVILQYWNYVKAGDYMYDSVYTNSEGKFVFNHRKHRGWSYRMWARAEHYRTSLHLDLTGIKPRPPYNFQLTR